MTRTLAIAGAAGAALLGGVVLTGAAGAQEPDEPTTDTPVAEAPADAPEGCRPGGRRGPNAEVAAEAIGIDVEALREALRGGSTLADVAEANGVDPQVVVEALLADVEAHLDEEVAEGELTQAEADERLAEATERIPERVEEGRPERGERPEAPAEVPGS